MIPVLSGSRAARVSTVALATVIAATAARGANPAPGGDISPEAIQVRFDPATRQTRVAGHVTPRLCFSISLPQEWTLKAQGVKARLGTGTSATELEMSLRSVHELRHLPQSDLARRDAALLQRDYEELLGRPAQSVSLASSAFGATRWSATWVDSNLPTASRTVTFETFIVPLSREWVLELSLANVESREISDALMERILSGLTVQGKAAC